MKKALISLLIFILIMAGVMLIDIRPQRKWNTGITVDSKRQTISCVSMDTYHTPIQIRTNPEYRFTSHTIIEDSTLPSEEERFVREYSLLGNLIAQDSQQEVNLKVTVRYFQNGDSFVIYRVFSTANLPSPVQLEITFPPSLSSKTNLS